MFNLIATREMLGVFVLGISSGLPLLLVGSTLKAWLVESGVNLATIGLFALVQIPYTLKFLWAPFLDRVELPFLDIRRGWIVVLQVLLSGLLLTLAQVDPSSDLWLVTLLCFLISFASATQDIAIDAYRREILEQKVLAFGASMGVNGYRIGMLLAGAFALPLAEKSGWTVTYVAMSLIMALLAIATPFLPAVPQGIGRVRTLRDAVVLPLTQFFRRSGAIEVLVFILLFKLGDQMASDMLTPFYLNVGFTKTEIGAISKFFGFWAVIAGGLIGGLGAIQFGLVRSLWIFGMLQAASTAGISLLAVFEKSDVLLAVVVAFENLTSGMGTAAFSAYMARLCDRKFSATQYALLSSLAGVPRAIFGASSGVIAAALGWKVYFVFCAIIAVPGLLLLRRAGRWEVAED